MSPPSGEKWDQLFHVYTICTLILFMKYFFSTLWAINNDNHPEEDKIFQPAPVPADIKRRERVFMNDVENIPFHMAILWGAFIVQNYCNYAGHGNHETSALIILMIVYTIARFLFTICYLFALQPFRTICFLISQFTIAATCIVMIISGFQIKH